MAGRKLTYRSKVEASTMVEVLISMVIIMVVFGIAMMIYANVTRSSLSGKKIKAEAVLNEAMLKAENTIENSTQTFMVDDFRIEQQIKNYNDDKNLIEIDLTAYDSNQEKVTELHKVIINKNEQAAR